MCWYITWSLILILNPKDKIVNPQAPGWNSAASFSPGLACSPRWPFPLGSNNIAHSLNCAAIGCYTLKGPCIITIDKNWYIGMKLGTRVWQLLWAKKHHLITNFGWFVHASVWICSFFWRVCPAYHQTTLIYSKAGTFVQHVGKWFEGTRCERFSQRAL
jgi:hypothetical protein